MEQVTDYTFNPKLKTEQEIKKSLSEMAAGTAHPYYDHQHQIQYLIILTTDGEFLKIRLSKDNLLSCFSGAKLSELEPLIASQIDKYHELTPFKEFSIVVAHQGEIYRIAADTSPVSMFVATNKIDGNYFDLQFCFADGTLLNYSNRINAGGARHSGDINSLLQYGDLTGLSNDSNFCASVVGFRKKPLHTFIEQQPSIVIVDSANNRLIIVPLSLDRTTIGEDSTFAILVSIKMVDGHLHYTICLLYTSDAADE